MEPAPTMVRDADPAVSAPASGAPGAPQDPGGGWLAPGDAQPVTADAEVERHADAGVVILVVDDDPVLGKVVEACLDFEGAEVRTAHTLSDAREALHPDLDHVVLDRRLPDGDGLELLEDLDRACPDAAVVVFSAYDDPGGPDDLQRVSKADVSGLIDLLGLERPDHEPPAPA